MAGYTPGQKATVAAAAITGILGLGGLLFAPLATELATSETPPADCYAIIQKYHNAAASSPEQRELILPGQDGQGYILRDPNAISCHIQPSDIEAGLPSLPPPPSK